MTVQQDNYHAPFVAPNQKPSAEQQKRIKEFADIHNAAQIIEHAIQHMKQFGNTSPRSEAALIKLQEAFGYITGLREEFEKEEVEKAKAIHDASVKDWNERMERSKVEVAKFEKEQEERIAKRAAELVQAAKPEQKAPSHPEPN